MRLLGQGARSPHIAFLHAARAPPSSVRICPPLLLLRNQRASASSLMLASAERSNCSAFCAGGCFRGSQVGTICAAGLTRSALANHNLARSNLALASRACGVCGRARCTSTRPFLFTASRALFSPQAGGLSRSGLSRSLSRSRETRHRAQSQVQQQVAYSDNRIVSTCAKNARWTRV